MARSATIGTFESTTMANERLTSSGIRPAATVRRDVGATLNVRWTVPLDSVRNDTVTVAGCALAFASSTNVEKKPCDPSAKNHLVRAPSTAVAPCDP